MIPLLKQLNYGTCILTILLHCSNSVQPIYRYIPYTHEYKAKISV